MKILFLGLFLAYLANCHGARILSILAMPSRSHGILMENILRELGNRGHQITYITAAPPKQGPIANMTLIKIPKVHEMLMANTPGDMDEKGGMLNLRGMSPWFIFFFTLAGPTLSDYILKDAAVKNLINSDETFDLILGETFLDESLLAGFSHRFQAPLVGIMSFMPNIWANYLTGNPVPTSFVPEPNLGYTTHMTFSQRLVNFVFSIAFEFHHPMIYLPMQDKLMRTHFGKDLPSIHDILRNTSLVLVNHHHALAFPRPYLPNMIEVAGMHIANVKPLPPALKKYMDEAKNGVVFFSMESNLKSSDMDPETTSAILRAFGKLPYEVIWKFENDKLDNLPKNVKIDKWLPQSDLLAHPNLKLFITHGGLLSTTEAVHRGVPVLGIPIFGDQPLNMKHTENAGLGRTLNYDDISEETLYNLIMELTTNPKYSSAAKFKSAVFQDNPRPPLEEAVWWVEYVLRHNGAYHLRSASQDLCWFQLHQLDVIATLGVALALVIYLVVLTIKKAGQIVCGIFCSKTNKQQKQKKSSKVD